MTISFNIARSGRASLTPDREHFFELINFQSSALSMSLSRFAARRASTSRAGGFWDGRRPGIYHLYKFREFAQLAASWSASRRDKRAADFLIIRYLSGPAASLRPSLAFYWPSPHSPS